MKKIVLSLCFAIGALLTIGCDDYESVVIQNYNLSGSSYAVAGQEYTGGVEVKGGSGEYEFSIIEGSLPVGLTIEAATGIISGVTHELSDDWFSFKVKVKDSHPDAEKLPADEYTTSAEREFKIKVIESPFGHDAYEVLGDNSYETTGNVLKVGDEPQLHTFPVPDDKDVYILDLTGVEKGTRIQVETLPVEGSASGAMNMYMLSYTNPTGNPLCYGQAYLNDSNASIFFYKGDADKSYLNLSGSISTYTISVTVYEADKYENDNDPLTTTNVYTPAAYPEYLRQVHTLTENDADYIKLDFTANSSNKEYKILTEHVWGGTFDGTKLSLYDASLNLLAENNVDDIITKSGYARIYWIFEPAVYYVKVTGDNTEKGEYVIRIEEYELWYGADEYEALNDSDFSTGNVITLNDGGYTSQKHTTHVTGDTDYIKLDFSTVTPGAVIAIDAGVDWQKHIPSIRLALYDSAKNLITEETYQDYLESQSARINYTLANPGIYYAKVFTTFNDVGQYQFDVFEICDVAADAYESDDDPDAITNTIVVDGEGQEHTFHSKDDVDYINLDLSGFLESDYILVKVTDGFARNVVVEVIRPNGHVLGGYNSFTTLTIQTPDVFKIRLRQRVGGDLGTYTVVAEQYFVQ
ncbi:MAG: hypothetical protein GY754_15795 [bacterium]|nr:hypothetical protein [bacterium]